MSLSYKIFLGAFLSVLLAVAQEQKRFQVPACYRSVAYQPVIGTGINTQGEVDYCLYEPGEDEADIAGHQYVVRQLGVVNQTVVYRATNSTCFQQALKNNASMLEYLETKNDAALKPVFRASYARAKIEQISDAIKSAIPVQQADGELLYDVATNSRYQLIENVSLTAALELYASAATNQQLPTNQLIVTASFLAHFRSPEAHIYKPFSLSANADKLLAQWHNKSLTRFGLVVQLSSDDDEYSIEGGHYIGIVAYRVSDRLTEFIVTDSLQCDRLRGSSVDTIWGPLFDFIQAAATGDGQ